ncbi:hypothetical protein [Amycolatopsis sp. NPDC003731]
MPNTKHEQHRAAVLLYLTEPGQRDVDTVLATRGFDVERIANFSMSFSSTAW